MTEKLTEICVETQEIQRREILRSAFITVFSGSSAVLASACGGGSGANGAASNVVVGGEVSPAPILIPSDPFLFAAPRTIAVSIGPFASIQEALDAETAIDWQYDPVRAQAVTLAYAARELQTHLKLMGVEATILSGTLIPSEPTFVLAVSNQLPTLIAQALSVDYPALGTEGYAITPNSKNVYVSAATRLGVLNGVYRLLDHLGVTWFDPYETQVVKSQIATTQTLWPKLSEVPRIGLRGFWIYGDQLIPDEFAVWMGRNRFNIGGRASWAIKNKLGLKYWGGEHQLLQEEFSKPGLFEAHPDWFALVSEVRRPVAAVGDYFNPSFANVQAANYFAERMIDRLEQGDLKEIDILNIWPSDSRFNNFDQSPLAKSLGNETDNQLHFCSVVRDKFQLAQQTGQLSRPVLVSSSSYFLTMQPPTNQVVIDRAQQLGYLHLFYPIDRSWAGAIDANLVDRDTNKKLFEALAAWKSVAKLNYGVVEYHNLSSFAAVCVSDAAYLSHNFEALSTGREGLFAYMHPLLANPGPRRLTNYLLSKMAWKVIGTGNTSMPSERSQRSIADYFERRYGAMAASWREVSELMARSVENAKELFGTNSLYWVLFQKEIWGSPFYSTIETAQLIGLYRAGGSQKLPGRFSGIETVRESFLGLNESIRLHQLAQSKWLVILENTIETDVTARMQNDIAWFKATASRYRLMDLNCDFELAVRGGSEASNLRILMQIEIDYLQTTPVTQDTLSPVNQRSFLDLHRRRMASS